MTVNQKQLYPAKVVPMGSASGYPASGFFAMHITYPDTEYDDDVTDWQYGTNSNTWGQGLTVIVRTPIATASAPSEANNVIVVDLKQAATDDTNSKTYNLGTEEATRLIAAKINSRRVKQVGEHSQTRYLRARYVRMSGKPSYSGSAELAFNATTLRVELDGAFRNGFPSDMPQSGTLTYTDSNHTNLSVAYTAVSAFRRGGRNYNGSPLDQKSYADFTVTDLAAQITQVGGSYPETISGATVSIPGEPAKHTMVLTWENTTPNSAGGYWAAANAGPIVQGLGQGIPTWYLTAKPMDGGNMGIPATNHESRGSTASSHSTAHGYVRFSIEGLNSCNLPDIPPPDYTVTEPSLYHVTKVEADTTGSNNIKLAEMEYGTDFPATSGDMFHLKSGYRATATNNSNNMLSSSRDNLTNITYGTSFEAKGIDGDGSKNVPRPIFSSKTINTTRVTGLQISNEEKVFEDIETVDDAGNRLTLTGGSPLGVVIKDYSVQNTRTDPVTGEEITGPSTTDGKLTPNLQIQLPDASEIPGEIFVRSAHDRVQAFSNLTWGLGGLTAPDPRKPGVAEASGGVSQFDTHDRMLIFHIQRLLHPDLTTKQGLTPHTTPGAVPSGTTRLFAAHRITDHAERGSLLTQTNQTSVSGSFTTYTGYAHPHHRIRFARQGHSFVTPMTHRGTPNAMRRQLHRSHGSSYSLLFEAETEHKHHGFGSAKSSNSSTVFELDSLDTKVESGYRATGSFASDGLPLAELDGFRLPDIKQSAHSGVTPRTDLDYLVAPGQEQTETDGAGHLVRRAAPSKDATTSGPTRLTFANALTGGSRYNTSSEIILNGFLIDDYTLSAGRPIAPVIDTGSSDYFSLGLEEGVLVPRSGTELGTVPPLLCHDPEYLNMAARTANPANDNAGINTDFGDFALLDKDNTGTGCVPDAFLCHWLAEYSHPALFGTSREHYLTFRYREAGTPRSLNYPPTRSLYLRNHSNPTTTAQAENALPFERLYITQWLQNFGYNALNASGQKNVDGMRSANAVYMGHTTHREAQGTLRLTKEYDRIRYSRGEGIGDGIQPEKLSATISYDTDSDSVSFTEYEIVVDNMVAYDFSRRLPVRAWGFRTSSDALNMLSGDPTEADTNLQPVFGSARFDGGVHDSVNKIPDATTYGSSWRFPTNYNGVERSLPIGLITTAHTAESTPFSSVIRRSNTKPLTSEQPIGIGLTLGVESAGLVKPTALPAGMWEPKTDPDKGANEPLKAIPMNKGSDPFIDLVQYTGSNSYSQGDSESAVSSTQFGVSGGFHHLKGNALHTNASAIDHSSTANIHYPTTGWGIGTHTNSTINNILGIPLSEISDHRQVQSRTEPRLGFVIQTENERQNNKNIEYVITSTKAASLHSDLIVGQHFPVLPSFVSNSKFGTHNMTINPGSPTSQTISNPYSLPTWSPDTKDDKGDGGAAVTSLSISNAGSGYQFPSGTLGFTGGGGGTGFTGTYTTSTNVASATVSGSNGQYVVGGVGTHSCTIAGNATATYTITNDGRPISNTISIGNGGSGFNSSTVSLTIGSPNASHNSVPATATATIGFGATISNPTSQEHEIDISGTNINTLTLDGNHTPTSNAPLRSDYSFGSTLAVNEDISAWPSSGTLYLQDGVQSAFITYSGKNTSGGVGNHTFTISESSHGRAFTFTSGSTVFDLNPNPQNAGAQLGTPTIPASTLTMTINQTSPAAQTPATVRIGYEKVGSKYYIRAGGLAYNITNAGAGFTSGGTKTVQLFLNGQSAYAGGNNIGFANSGNVVADVSAATTNGKIISVTVNNQGDGYTSAPSVSAPGGTGESLTASLASGHTQTGTITAVTIGNNGGSGYTSAPAITLPTTHLKGGGTAQTATAVLGSTGPLVSVSIGAGGSGYTTTPTIVVNEGGSSAVVVATVSLPTNPDLLIASKTHGMDYWAVRGSADLPPWGGTYILRKTYLNRTEEGTLTTDVFGTDGNATTSNQRRKSIDYFVRPVRPLKLFGFASDIQQDGWLMGARSSYGDADLEHQAFTRDNRYGVFEANMERNLGDLKFISTAEGIFQITYPDANEHDAVFHLLPSASMLQFFKSDAVRKTVDGEFNPEIEARYSQTTHPGGGESLHQSETRYRAEGTGISGDFVKQTTPDAVTHTHMDSTMRLYPQFKVTKHAGSNNNVFLEDASLLPASGTLFIVGKGKVTYTGKSKNKLTGITNSTGVSDLTGQILRYTTVTSPSAISDIRSLTTPHLVSPTYIDNAITLAKQVSATWHRYDVTNDAVKQTTLGYRGLLEYDPTDFMMINQRPLIIDNGKTSALVSTSSPSITAIRFDGKEVTDTDFPPYLFDQKNTALRIAGVEKDELSTFLLFRNIEADSLTDFGLSQGPILMGQQGYIGVRTSDAAMMLLDDSGSDLAGFNVTPTSALLGKDREISSTLDAHPSLRLVSDHSAIFTARKTKGLNVMEVIRNLSQIDGKQLINEKNGAMVYSSNVFNNKGMTFGMGSAIRSVTASKMFDSPNEIVIVGDQLAQNERVFVVVKDLERMKKEASKGASSNLVRTLRQEIPGLKTNSEALKLAKSILSRSENSAPLITISGAIKASMVQPGEIINIDLPMHGLRGEYMVFEATHNYIQSTSDFIVAQYDKGIEGILSDLQAVSGNASPLDDAAGKVVDVAEVSLSSGINVVAVHKVFVRSVSNTGFIIGAKHTNGMGKIGVRDGNKRGRAIGTSKSLYYEVK